MRLLISTAVVCAATLCAQAPAGPANLQGYLSLTDSQVQALRQLRQQHHQTMAPLMQQMRQKRQALDSQLNSSNSSGAAQAMADMKTVRDSITAAQTSYRNQALGLLTSDQRAKVQELENAAALRRAIGEAAGLGLLSEESAGFHRGMGPGFRGGPRGPGGPPVQQQ